MVRSFPECGMQSFVLTELMSTAFCGESLCETSLYRSKCTSVDVVIGIQGEKKYCYISYREGKKSEIFGKQKRVNISVCHCEFPFHPLQTKPKQNPHYVPYTVPHKCSK